MDDIDRKTFGTEYGAFLRKVLYIAFLIGVAAMLVTGILMSDISRMSAYTYALIEDIPYNKTGLLLGTSKYVARGRLNEYYVNRINSAFELYYNGKIDYIIVSGDNATSSYNEPRNMRKDLIRLGIPAERIYLDYAGFSTLDSVLRTKYIFRQNRVTVISQDFHNERAIYISRENGMNAIGFNAPAPRENFFVSTVREFFAKLKCILDVHILKRRPKFLGEVIEIGSHDIKAKHAQLHDPASVYARDPAAKPDFIDSTVVDGIEYNRNVKRPPKPRAEPGAGAFAEPGQMNPLTNDLPFGGAAAAPAPEPDKPGAGFVPPGVPEAAPEAAPEAGPEAESETGSEAEPEAAPETAPEAAPAVPSPAGPGPAGP